MLYTIPCMLHCIPIQCHCQLRIIALDIHVHVHLQEEMHHLSINREGAVGKVHCPITVVPQDKQLLKGQQGAATHFAIIRQRQFRIR